MLLGVPNAPRCDSRHRVNHRSSSSATLVEKRKERCESGRIGLTANELTGEKPVRGFKSLPLRKW
jgi:hypothetical protein